MRRRSGGYTGAAGWMLRQAFEGVIGASLIKNKLVLPGDLGKPRGPLSIIRVRRDVRKSPLQNGLVGPKKSLEPIGNKGDREVNSGVFSPELGATID